MTQVTHSLLIDKARNLASSPLFQILLWIIVLDIITGYAKAIKNRTLDSKVSTNGWIRHFIVFIIVFIVGVYSRILNQQGFSYLLCSGFIGSYGLSLLENLEAIGVWFPKGFKDFFKQMRDRNVSIPNADIYIKTPETMKNIIVNEIENTEIQEENTKR